MCSVIRFESDMFCLRERASLFRMLFPDDINKYINHNQTQCHIDVCNFCQRFIIICGFGFSWGFIVTMKFL